MTDFRILRRLLHLTRRNGVSIGTAYRQVAEEMNVPLELVTRAYLVPHNKRVSELFTTPRGALRMFMGLAQMRKRNPAMFGAGLEQ